MSQHGYPERVSQRAARGGKACAEDAGTIEVLVETLTGTAFEMTVSPLDTVLAIKAKIFRVEGIPISQQHLLYNLQELDDASSLQEHCIDDGATLRLVLAMRGGPVSTHRLPAPAPAQPAHAHWRDYAEHEVDWAVAPKGMNINFFVKRNQYAPAPAQPAHAHWRDYAEHGVDCDDGGEWLPAGSKVTVLVFRDGDNVSMVRVVENEDGSYSPLADTHVDNSPSLKSFIDEINEDGNPGSLQDNAVTMGKMLELRRRMETLSLRRGARPYSGDRLAENADSALIQKTRSEETLSTIDGLFEEAAGALDYQSRRLQYAALEADDTFAPLHDGYAHDYDCSFADRYTLLPPISADSEQSSEEVAERVKLSDALAGPILVKSSRREEAARGRACPDAARLLGRAPVPAAEYGPLVGGETGGWRVRRAFGSSSQLAPPAPLAPAHSASSLQPRPARAPHPRHHPPLSDALFSSSTSDLEKLKRNRFLPALCRHRNRENLDVSDERLDRDEARPEEARRPARSLEVGSERRHRRIKKIAELESARTEAPRPSLFRFDNSGYESSIRKLPNDGVSEGEPSGAAVGPEERPPPEAAPAPETKKLVRVRCGLCRKRLSIATVHRCRCGAEFCAPHRYAEVHGCAYDYKAHAHQYLQRANPLVSAPKLPKI